MAVSRDVARVNFGRFVRRALTSARRRGLTDPKITELTGVGPSTFHRWGRGEWGRGWPELQKVIDFCEGLSIASEDAFAALGISGERQPVEPTEPLDPDVRVIMRRLADPNVSEAEKTSIRATLRYLADLADRQEPGEGRGRQAS